MSKKGLLLRLTLIIILTLVFIFLILNKFVGAETSTGIINITITINSSNVLLNVSNSVYTYNNTNLSEKIQQNFSVSFASNISASNASNIICVNSTVQVSCSCANINCTIPSAVDLTNETKQLFFNHYQTELKTKIEESMNKGVLDLKFALEPSNVLLESFKQQSFNASLRQFEAERQRDKFAADNIALGVSLESIRNELKTLQLVFYFFIGFIFVAFLSYLGFTERFGKLW